MLTALQHAHLFAGLSWDPAIKGILVVLVGVTILMGSIYLIIATNTGARLGLMIALGGLFGWLSILTMYWWIVPPGIGPRGQDPSWRPVEIYVHEPNAGPARTEALNNLPSPVVWDADKGQFVTNPKLPTAAQIIQNHPELADQFVTKPENTTLSDVAAAKLGSNYAGAEILKREYGIDSTQPTPVAGDVNLGNWRIMTTSEAGDAAAAADVALQESGMFKDATLYKKLNAYTYQEGDDIANGNLVDPTLDEACPGVEEDAHGLIPSDLACRVKYRLRRTFQLWHPPHYVVVQLQPVIPQETVAGAPPPIPKVDPTKPVISVVLERDQGNVRAKPAYFFVICFSVFLIFVLLLHYRDKTLEKNLAIAEKAKADAKAKG